MEIEGPFPGLEWGTRDFEYETEPLHMICIYALRWVREKLYR